MTHVSLYQRARARLVAGWRHRAVSFKAIAFAFVGVVNTAVDYCVFLIARAALDRSPSALALFASVSDFCQCGNAPTISLIAANTMSWIVAVSGSYIMNSTIHLCRGIGAQAPLARLLCFCRLRHRRLARQHGDASGGGGDPVAAGVAR